MLKRTVEQLASQYGLSLCVECGKCVAACPMSKIFSDLTYEASPRGIIERVLLDSELPESSRLWLCLTCNLCTGLCPAGVRFRDFVEAARLLRIQAGEREQGVFCRRCGTFLWPQHTVEYLKHSLGQEAEERMALCLKCRQLDAGRKIKDLTPGNRRVLKIKPVGEHA